MSANAAPQDRLFLALARTLDLDAAFELVQTDQELSRLYDLNKFFDTAKSLNSANIRTFATTLRVLTSQNPEEILPLYLFWYLAKRGDSLSLGELNSISEVSVKRCRALLLSYRATQLINAGDADKAKDLLERSLKQATPTCRPPFERYIHATQSSVLGVCYQKLGDFQRAHRCLKSAHAICRADGLLAEWSHGQRLATLLWASGQYQEALLIHKNVTIREEARKKKKFDFLLSSHLSAAKCAVDLKQTAVAEQELTAAREILDSDYPVRKELSGYYLLFCGEVRVQKGDVQKSMRLLQMSQKYFENMSPPHYQGALEAKIALAHFALYEKNYPVAMRMLQKLLEEAEERQCLDARSRLLLLETFLFVTEEPPVRRAYEDLTTRVHLINNPSFLLRALGNLYTYALEFLDEEQQAFLLMRIRNIKPVLDASCYDDLYGSYVTDRYEYAIENRLARFVDRDLRNSEIRLQDEDDSGDPPKDTA